jgi:glucokinase
MNVLAIDIGGTKTALALVDTGSGKIRDSERLPTPAPELAGLSFMDELLGLAEDWCRSDVAAIGVSLCEIVTPTGIINSGHRVRFRGLPLLDGLNRLRPAVVEADVRAAALADARYGMGRHHSSFLYVNCGTGISSCLVQGGIPWAGSHGSALVFANAPTRVADRDGQTISYILEDIAGGAGLASEYLLATGQLRTAEHILGLAQSGDAPATKITARAAQALGMALGHAADMLDPAAIVLGGGLAQSLFFVSALERELRNYIWSDAVRPVPLLASTLKGDACLLGAACAADQAFCRR